MSLISRLGTGLSVAAVGLAGIVSSGCGREPHHYGDLERIAQTRPVFDGKGVKIASEITEEGFDVLKARGVNRDVAVKYDSRFMDYDVSDIVLLHASGVTPDIANAYPAGISARDIVDFNTAHMSPSTLDAYNSVLRNSYATTDDLIHMNTIGLTPDILAGYLDPSEDKNLTGASSAQAIALFEKSVPVSYAVPLLQVFDHQSIILMHAQKVSIETANKYRSLITKYGARIDGRDVVNFEILQIPLAEIEANVREDYIKQSLK